MACSKESDQNVTQRSGIDKLEFYFGKYWGENAPFSLPNGATTDDQSVKGLHQLKVIPRLFPAFDAFRYFPLTFPGVHRIFQNLNIFPGFPGSVATMCKVVLSEMKV